MSEAEAESRRAVDAFNAYHYRYTADRLAPPAGRPHDDVPSADYAARLMERVRPWRKLVQRRRTRTRHLHRRHVLRRLAGGGAAGACTDGGAAKSRMVHRVGAAQHGGHRLRKKSRTLA